MTDHIIKAAQEAEAYATSQTADILDWKAIAQDRFYAIAYQQGMEKAAEICESRAQMLMHPSTSNHAVLSAAGAIRAHAENLYMTTHLGKENGETFT